MDTTTRDEALRRFRQLRDRARDRHAVCRMLSDERLVLREDLQRAADELERARAEGARQRPRHIPHPHWEQEVAQLRERLADTERRLAEKSALWQNLATLVEACRVELVSRGLNPDESPRALVRGVTEVA